MASISAVGVGIRHAVARALATVNLAPADATFRVVSARVQVDGRGRVQRADATIEVEEARPVGAWRPSELRGLVNPDGAHPLMVRIPAARPFFLDIVPVTWDRWLRRHDDTLPPFIDPLCPRVGVTWEAAREFARRAGRDLPTETQLRAGWGEEAFPWGERTDPTRGRVGAPRFDELPEVGLLPPDGWGAYDLGAWLWHWTREGTLFGGHDRDGAGPSPPDDARRPVGFRMVCDA